MVHFSIKIYIILNLSRQRLNPPAFFMYICFIGPFTLYLSTYLPILLYIARIYWTCFIELIFIFFIFGSLHLWLFIVVGCVAGRDNKHAT